MDERLASLDHLRIQPKSEEDFKKQERVENLDAIVTPWPAWVYRQYDPLRLSLKIRQRLQFIESSMYFLWYFNFYIVFIFIFNIIKVCNFFVMIILI